VELRACLASHLSVPRSASDSRSEDSAVGPTAPAVGLGCPALGWGGGVCSVVAVDDLTPFLVELNHPHEVPSTEACLATTPSDPLRHWQFLENFCLGRMLGVAPNVS
jgi:hypothetical protein